MVRKKLKKWWIRKKKSVKVRKTYKKMTYSWMIRKNKKKWIFRLKEMRI